MRAAADPRAVVAGFVFGLVFVTEPGAASATGVADEAAAGDPHTPLRLGPVYRVQAGAGFGRGLRFNNPYRLATELGASAESLSATAYYFVGHVGAVVGGTGPLHHGASLHLSVATDGIPQEVIAPSYLLVHRFEPRWALRARAGLPIVIEPDLNAGFEVAAGATFHLTAALGVTADLVGSLFYGAATLDTPRTAIPVASLELGVVYDYEVLP